MFDQNTLSSLISNVLTSYIHFCLLRGMTLNLQMQPIGFIIFIVVNMSAKFDENLHYGLVSVMFTRSKSDTPRPLT